MLNGRKKPTRTGPEYDYLFKLVLAGDSGVGKSSLLLRFADDTFTESFISTIGVDYKCKTLDIYGNIVKLQIWDTAGQERFRTITSNYYRDPPAAIICFDLTNPETFNNVPKWIREVEKISSSSDGFQIIVVGTKSDLHRDRKISYDDAQELCEQLGVPYFETSAKNNLGITKMFTELAIKVGRIVSDDDTFSPKTLQKNSTKINQKIKKALMDDVEIKNQFNKIKSERVRNIIKTVFNIIDKDNRHNDFLLSMQIENVIENHIDRFTSEDVSELISAMEGFSKWSLFGEAGPLYFLKQSSSPIAPQNSFFNSTIFDQITNTLSSDYKEKRTHEERVKNESARKIIRTEIKNPISGTQKILNLNEKKVENKNEIKVVEKIENKNNNSKIMDNIEIIKQVLQIGDACVRDALFTIFTELDRDQLEDKTLIVLGNLRGVTQNFNSNQIEHLKSAIKKFSESNPDVNNAPLSFLKQGEGFGGTDGKVILISDVQSDYDAVMHKLDSLKPEVKINNTNNLSNTSSHLFKQSNEPVAQISEPEGPPDNLICMISGELMTDPVITATGHTYQRNAIEQWIEKKGEGCLDPVGRLPITKKGLITNRSVKDAVDAWLLKHPDNESTQNKKGL